MDTDAEPWVPNPAPEAGHWNPSPDRCAECGSVLQDMRPGEDGRVGWCPDHGWVPGVTRDTHDIEEDDDG
jgi:hypothetical protein